MSSAFIDLVYLVAAVLFIFGLKGLSRPRTAARANLIAAGMLLAVVVTLFDQRILSYELILIGLVIGAAIGALMALRVEMTAMPQMVALFNGVGGGASMLIAGASLFETIAMAGDASLEFLIAVMASTIIGAVTLAGSLVAAGKLQGVISEDPQSVPGQQVLNAGLLLVAILLGAWLVADPTQLWLFWVALALCLVLGVTLVSPIGGADMPVVIALFNSYSGLAAAATGFVLDNNALIITGSLVGASGLILTNIMCKAMNRSLTNVLFGKAGATAVVTDGHDVYDGKVKATSPEEVAMLLEGAQRVVLVPGYGMAVAQAQHAARDLAEVLRRHGADVEFGIHPVAGRMPGHMNVLLAEAEIPYEQLREMDDVNSAFSQTDVVIVVGANDVVNPLARTDPTSPIAGMPILDVDKARSVVVLKRSLSPGFAKIPNPLFAADNTLMLFMDAKKGLQETVAALEELIS